MPPIAMIGVALAEGLMSTVSGIMQSNAQSDAAKAQKQAQQQALQQQAQQQADANKKLIVGNLPNAVSQTGGYLTNTGDLGLSGTLSGLPGAAFTGYGQGALGQFLGSPGGTGTEAAGASQGLAHPQGIMAMLAGLGEGGGGTGNMTQNTFGISGQSV